MTYQIPTKWMAKAIGFGITLHCIKKATDCMSVAYMNENK